MNDSTIPLKRCPKCGETKPATTEYFARNKSESNGFQSRCKSCGHAYSIANRKRLTERMRVYREANKEKVSKRERAYREAHKEGDAERGRAWYAANRERLKVLRRARYEANKERELDRNRAYHAANKDKHRIRQQRRRALVSNAEGKHTEADIKAQYKRQKGKCYWCGEKLDDAYHVDHIVPLSRGGSNWPENLVISCPHCNTSKHDKLPHEWPEGGRLL